MTNDQMKDIEPLLAEMGERLKQRLRQEFPYCNASAIAREFGASHNTIEKWLGGNLPANKHMFAMVERWGWPFLEFVYEPCFRGHERFDPETGFDEIRAKIDNIERLYKARKGDA